MAVLFLHGKLLRANRLSWYGCVLYGRHCALVYNRCPVLLHEGESR